MSRRMRIVPLAASLATPLTAPRVAMRVSRDLLTGFGAVSRVLSILPSHGWHTAGRPTETIDECLSRAARAPFLPAAAGLQ
jgi:hypothetical protein